MDYYTLSAEAMDERGFVCTATMDVHERDSEVTSPDEWYLSFSFALSKKKLKIVGPMSISGRDGPSK